MITESIGKHKIERFNSIDELKTKRFFIYNRMLLIDSGIGSSMEDIDGHITKIMTYLSMDKKEEARTELMNMRGSLYFVLENMSPKHLSYVALIHSIDGKEVTDLSDENLNKILKQLSDWGAERGYLDKALDAVKKNFKLNLKPIFLKYLRVR